MRKLFIGSQRWPFIEALPILVPCLLYAHWSAATKQLAAMEITPAHARRVTQFVVVCRLLALFRRVEIVRIVHRVRVDDHLISFVLVQLHSDRVADDGGGDPDGVWSRTSVVFVPAVGWVGAGRFFRESDPFSRKKMCRHQNNHCVSIATVSYTCPLGVIRHWMGKHIEHSL